MYSYICAFLFIITTFNQSKFIRNVSNIHCTQFAITDNRFQEIIVYEYSVASSQQTHSCKEVRQIMYISSPMMSSHLRKVTSILAEQTRSPNTRLYVLLISRLIHLQLLYQTTPNVLHTFHRLFDFDTSHIQVRIMVFSQEVYAYSLQPINALSSDTFYITTIHLVTLSFKYRVKFFFT